MTAQKGGIDEVISWLIDTADALAAAHRESVRNRTNFFNISATAGQDNKLALSSNPPVTIFPLGGTVCYDSAASGTRGNTVTVVLASKACTGKGCYPPTWWNRSSEC